MICIKCFDILPVNIKLIWIFKHELIITVFTLKICFRGGLFVISMFGVFLDINALMLLL